MTVARSSNESSFNLAPYAAIAAATTIAAVGFHACRQDPTTEKTTLFALASTLPPLTCYMTDNHPGATAVSIVASAACVRFATRRPDLRDVSLAPATVTSSVPPAASTPQIISIANETFEPQSPSARAISPAPATDLTNSAASAASAPQICRGANETLAQPTPNLGAGAASAPATDPSTKSPPIISPPMRQALNHRNVIWVFNPETCLSVRPVWIKKVEELVRIALPGYDWNFSQLKSLTGNEPKGVPVFYVMGAKTDRNPLPERDGRHLELARIATHRPRLWNAIAFDSNDTVDLSRKTPCYDAQEAIYELVKQISGEPMEVKEAAELITAIKARMAAAAVTGDAGAHRG